MDITSEFRACVKAAKLGNRKISVDSSDKTAKASKTGKSEFDTRAASLVSEIRALKEFLLRNRRSYLNSAWHVGSESLLSVPHSSSGMTDADRDEIDAWTQRLIKACSDAVKQFRPEAAASSSNLQTRQHREAVVHLVEQYLKLVCRIYTEQKAVRLKRMVEHRTLSRLDNPDSVFGLRKRRNQLRPTFRFDESAATASSGAPPTAAGDAPAPAPKPALTSKMSHDMDEEAKATDGSDDVEMLTAAEIQVFESENASLINRLQSMKDEVRQIQSKVVKIAELQEIFTKKVLEQEKDIEIISEAAVGTTENVNEGNEQVREAMKKNAGLRVWILFFFLMMSFAILFLDWYNE